ncbi:hypothetical protein [Virgibacillus salexigens]|uniref:Uncharacterized protein n=1 Tax=Virgibacillus massiliensis TaxID=1462526 RepID=A0A024QHV8_9BACI|nr:hypothetical protein [Virgibacillus massiliensis]CDQ42133.1 hypothetical protein BN990_04513 [Virgibacillus massiliensis]
MNGELLQGIADIVFGGYMLYLAPFLLLMMVIQFGDRLIELIISTVDSKGSRRTSY